MQYNHSQHAVEFLLLYEKERLQQPMELIGESYDDTTHMNHYRLCYNGHYLECHASTEKPMIEIGLQRVSEKLPYTERNLTLALALCHDFTESNFAAKVHCYADYDKGTIYFDVWFQSLVPQLPEDLDYMIDGVLILADTIIEGVDDLIEQLKSEQENKPNSAKHYD